MGLSQIIQKTIMNSIFFFDLMTSTPLEKLRQQYQDIEEFRKRAVHLMLNPPRTIKEAAYCTHHEARYAREIQKTSTQILKTLEKGIERVEDPITSFYTDLERRIQFHQEIADRQNEKGENDSPEENQKKLAGEVNMNDMVTDIKGTIHLSMFYDNDRYQEWRRKRKESGNEKKSRKNKKVIVPETDEALTKFSGEECYGQYLDLYDLHREYISTIQNQNQQKLTTSNLLKNINLNASLIASNKQNEGIISYLEFLEKINNANKIDFIPKTPQGEKFLQSFIDYLISFITRTDPFFDIDSCLKSIDASFERQYSESDFQQNQQKKKTDYYCAFCNRYFDTPELLQNHTKQKSHQKNEEKAEKAGGLSNLIEERRMKSVKHDKQCYTLFQLIERVRPKLVASIENTKRRQTLSAAVLEAEANLDAPIVFDESDDEDEQHFYNPKGLPLGWDGKPIPYWLYKLHGLSVEYKCEICGNKSYWGSLSFERHFFDTKHINGLKAIGIPPTRHFLYVTKVSEALQLYDKIKKTLEHEVWQPGDEEVETEDGQVMSYKIYRDLKNQGFIKQKAIKPK